jgi:hypothetical protein
VFVMTVWTIMIRKVHRSAIVPFLEMFYGTLPYTNPQGLARSQDDPRYSPRPRWGWLLKRTAAVGAMILLLLAVLSWIDRSWVTVARPLAVSNLLGYSRDSSTVYFTNDGHFSVVGSLGQQTFHRSVDGCYRPAGPRKPADDQLHGSNGQGLITLKQNGGGNDDPLRCSIQPRPIQSDIPPAFCDASAFAMDDSRRYLAIMERTPYAKVRLLIWDALEQRDLDPVELAGSLRIQLAFALDGSLLVLHDEQITNYSHLGSGRPTISLMELPGSPRIQAFAISGDALLATIDLDGHLNVYDHGSPASYMKAAKNDDLSSPLLAFSSDGNTLVLVQNGYAEFYDWHRHDYLAHFFDRQKHANARSSH